MKISTMPYGEIDINSKTWWTACNVYNPSGYSVSCTIKLFDKTGKLRGEESRILAAKESYMISPGWIRSKLSADATRHTIEVYGDVLVSSYIADDSRAIFTDNPIFVTDSDDTELRYKYNFFKEYWNNKQPKEIIHYITRSLLVGRNEQQRCPVQLYVTPNDPVIVEDIVKNNLMVKDIWNCDRDIVEIYRHTRFKTINPFNYVTDIANVKKDEYWMFPWELRQYKAGDCFVEGTEVLTDRGEIALIQDIRIGDKILGGDGKVVSVNMVWDRGVKTDIKELVLNNGDALELSSNHKLLVYEDYDEWKNSGKLVEKTVKDLNIGDSIPYPDKLTFSETISFESDLAYLFGLYIADGWIHSANSFRIAGKDGEKKQLNKEWVKQFCEKYHIEYNWHRRYITVKWRRLVMELSDLFGSGCKSKRFTKLNFDEDTARAILEGWKADACERDNELTYSTINRNLALACRTLNRIIGLQTTIKKVVNHGGLGKNPIFRITVLRKKVKRCMIKQINDVEPKHCFDISTSDGLVYLPRYDLIVRQCDDWSAELASYLIAAGVPNWRVRMVVGDTFNGGGHSTVYVLRDDLRTWRHVDSTMMIGGNVTSLDHMMFNTNTGMSIKTVWCSFNNEYAWRRFDGQTVAETEFAYLKVGA